jgi:hypothetical protein
MIKVLFFLGWFFFHPFLYADQLLENLEPIPSTLLIPAQPAPRSASEIFGEEGVTLNVDHIDAVRGRRTVNVGDAVKGGRYEEFKSPIEINAPSGKV